MCAATRCRYSEDDANQTATNLHEAQVALMANVTQDDIRAFLQGVVSPSRVLVALAGAVCVVFGHEPQWNAAMRILLAPDFYDVAMALTPDMLHQDRRRTLRQLFHQHRLLHTATLTGNEVIFLLARWVGAMVGLLNDHIPEEHLPEPQRTISRHNSAVSAAGSVRSTESRRSGASASNSVRMRGAVGTSPRWGGGVHTVLRLTHTLGRRSCTSCGRRGAVCGRHAGLATNQERAGRPPRVTPG